MIEYRKKFISLDLETTHLDVKEGRIMEVGAVEIELVFDPSTSLGTSGPVKVNFGKTFSTLVNPEIEPSETALLLTGIKKEELAAAPKWPEVRKDLESFVGTGIILGHNIGFDLGYLANQGLNLKKNLSLDTLELAQTLLPLFVSHSLEYLGEHFQVLEDEPHRALVDSQNAGRVLPAILNEFLKYPVSLRQDIRKLLENSQVSFRDMVLDLPVSLKTASRGGPETKGSKGGKGVKNRENPETLPSADINLDFKDKTIYCFPISHSFDASILNHLKAKKEQAIVGVSHTLNLDFLPDADKISSPRTALCDIRVARLRAHPDLPAVLTRIIIKIAILQQHQAWDISQIRWNWQEVPFLHLVSADPDLCLDHECGYAQSLAKTGKGVRFSGLKSLFSLVRDWDARFSEHKLLLFDLAAIEDEFTQNVLETYSLRKIRNAFSVLYPIEKEHASIMDRVPKEIETVINELDLFFGILHLVYLKREGDFAQNLAVSEAEREGERFSKLLAPAEKLAGRLAALDAFLETQIAMAEPETVPELEALKTKVKDFSDLAKRFFLEADTDNIRWLKFNSAWVDINLQPKKLDESWQKFSKKFASLTIADTELPSAALRYYENRLGLSDFQSQPCAFPDSKHQVPVTIYKKTFDAAGQMAILKNLSGRTVVIVPNETKLGELFQALRKDEELASRVLAHKHSGSVGQVRSKAAKFGAGEKFILLLTTHALFKYWKSFLPVDNLVIYRLPFEAQGSKPTLMGLEAASAFPEYILPRAIHQMHFMFSRFLSAHGENQRILILDPRILDNYDQSFMRYLEEFPIFSVSTV